MTYVLIGAAAVAIVIVLAILRGAKRIEKNDHWYHD